MCIRDRIKGAASGMKVDLISKYSQDSNALGVLESHFTGLNIPLATKEHDHPMMKTFKNVVEGMGLGVLSDTVLSALGVGFKKTGKAIGNKISPDNSILDANKASREIQRKKTGNYQANGSKQDQQRLAQIYKIIGEPPGTEKFKTLTAQRTQLRNQRRTLMENLDPDDVKTKQEISELLSLIHI